MTQIDWNDVNNVGLSKIDSQHKELITLSNGLLQAMTVGKGADVLEETLVELRAYTEKHFREEERLMEEIAYPKLEDHKRIHKLLAMEVDTFHKELTRGNVSPRQALVFINGWIVKHINEMDSKIGEFARSRKAQ